MRGFGGLFMILLKQAFLYTFFLILLFHGCGGSSGKSETSNINSVAAVTMEQTPAGSTSTNQETEVSNSNNTNSSDTNTTNSSSNSGSSSGSTNQDIIDSNSSNGSSSDANLTVIFGKVIDGYIKNATVCIDTNENNFCEDELSTNRTISDENGTFSFNQAQLENNSTIIAYGGNDTVTNQPFNYIVKNIASNKSSDGKIILSGLTTIVIDYKKESNSSLNTSETIISDYLGGLGATTLNEDIADGNYSTQLQLNLKIFKIIELIHNESSINVEHNYSNSAITFRNIAKAIDNNLSIRISDATILIDWDGNKTITIGNSPPIFTSTNSFVKYVGENRFIVNLTASDPDGDDINFSLKPIFNSNLFVVDSNGTTVFKNDIEYNRTIDGNNSLLITVIATDNYAGDNKSAEQNITIYRKATGLDIYNSRGDSTDAIKLNDINYLWDNTNKWYINTLATPSTILMPIKKVNNIYDRGINFNFKFDGHFDVNSSDYINAVHEPTINHLVSNTYLTADGVTRIQLNSDKFQHDPVHGSFVSKVLNETSMTKLSNVYDDFINSNKNFVVANDLNSTYATGEQYSIYFNDTSDTDDVNYNIFVDSNNTIDSKVSICSQKYGEGWRIPTAYEMGLEDDSVTSIDPILGGNNGFIPAYLGNDSSKILTSSRGRIGSSINLVISLNQSNGEWSYTNFSQAEELKCVYIP